MKEVSLVVIKGENIVSVLRVTEKVAQDSIKKWNNKNMQLVVLN